MRRLVSVAVASLLATALAAPAHAAPPAAPSRSCALVPMPAPPRAATAPAATSNVIFLNDCRAPGSCDLLAGFNTMTNDSRTNTSAVVKTPTTLEPWPFSAQEWDSLVGCVRRLYQPFDVQIVTTEPPATAEYFEAMVAGRATQLGFAGGIVGVAPFTCDAVIPNAIAFAFANDYANQNASNAADLCWTVAHEIAHVFGLQHKYDARDPMTYLQPPLPQKLFVDDAGACGAYAARDCTKADSYEDGCSASASTTMNSYRKIAAIFGAKPGTPPSLTVAQPLDGSSPTRGFSIAAQAEDDVRVRDVALFLDDVLVEQPKRTPPYEWKTPRSLPDGPHALSLRATDYYGATTRVDLAVTSVPQCSGAAAGCAEGDLCLAGNCIAGPEKAGGLGTRCSGPSECASTVCAAAGKDQFCVEACQLGGAKSEACPAGFRCLASGDGGVCWPDDRAEDGGGCGCAGGEAGEGAPIALGLGFVALLASSRRRRRSGAASRC